MDLVQLASLVAAGIALVATWYVGSWLLSPHLRGIPGPTSAAWTRLWHINHIVKGDQNVVLVDLHEKHGRLPACILIFICGMKRKQVADIPVTQGPFIRIAPDEVSVGHPDGIRKLLLAPLHKGYWYKALAIPDYRFQTPMSQTDPKTKNQMSRNFSSGYTLTNVLQNEQSIEDVVKMFLERLDDFAAKGKAFDLARYFTFMAFDVVGEVIFSKQFGFLSENRDIGHAIENGTVLSVYASVIGFARWVHVALLGNPFMTWLGILPMGHLYCTTVDALEKRFINRDSRYDAAAHWIKAMEKNPDKIKERDIYAVATGAVGAGSDTVSCALQSFVYHMNRHPDAWQRVRSEMKEAIKEQGLCQDRVVSYTDSQKLPFLQLCIKESLRVFSPVPMGLPRREPPEGITIGGQYFPASSILSINAWVMHHNKDIWGPDAREFNPYRWTSKNGPELEKFFMSVSTQLHPPSVGRRI